MKAHKRHLCVKNFTTVFNLLSKIALQGNLNQLQTFYDCSTFGLKNIRKVICGRPPQTLKSHNLKDLSPQRTWEMPGHCMQHTKWKATNNRAVSCQQVASLSVAFWIQACAVLFLWVSPVYFGELLSPQSPDNRSAVIAEVAWLALKYLWFFSVVIVWVLTAVARYCAPSPNKRPDVLLSVVTWRGETECMHHTSSLQTPNSSPCIKDRFYWSPSISIRCFYFLLFHYFLEYYFLQIPSWQSVFALSPLCAFSSHSVSNLISFAVSSLHHINNDRLMAASAAPLYNVIIKPLASVPTNLQQVCLHTDCRWFDI